MTDTSTTPAPAGRNWPRHLVWALIALFIALVLTAVFYQAFWYEAPPAPTPAPAPVAAAPAPAPVAAPAPAPKPKIVKKKRAKIAKKVCSGTITVRIRCPDGSIKVIQVMCGPRQEPRS